MIPNSAPFLSLITFAPLVGAAVVLLLPKDSKGAIKMVSLIATLVSLFLTHVVWHHFDPNAGMMFEERSTWIPAMNIDYHLGVDGLSITMILLTTIIMPLALLASWKQERNVKLFFLLFLLLETGMLGVFTALNFFHWFIFWELGLIPMFFLIRIWGAEDRTYASFKFFLYTVAGSVGMLLAFAFIYLATNSLDFVELRRMAASGELATALSKFVDGINAHIGTHISPACFASLLFWGTFLGFAIKVPIWPFHTWLPDAHTQAPTGGSMVLAAILLKMGVYGFLRIVLPIFPYQVQANVNILLFLALASIVFGAYAALAQTDFKRLVAYSSVNHMGYAMLGIFVTVATAANVTDIANEKAAALNGAVLQMFNHGISSAALFFLVGVIYERTHTRKLSEYGGLRKIMPIYAGVLGISMFSSLGLPGLNGFVGEFLVFKGAFPIVPLVSSLATIGLVITGVFLLGMMQKVCFGPLNEKWKALTDMNTREICIIAVLMFFMFWIGLYPGPMLDVSNKAAMQLVDLSRIWVTNEIMQVDWTIYLTFLGAGLILLLPRDSKNLIRWVALLTGIAALIVGLKNYFDYNTWVNAELAAHNGKLVEGFQQIVNVSWIPALNVNYHLAVDGISYPLIILNGFVCVTGILFSWNIENRVKEFFAFFLTLIAGVYGVFMSMDLFLLFVFYELAIIPKYFVIAIWGSTRKEYGAMKLVLYSFVGSALVFIGILAVFFNAGGQTFDILELVKHPLARDVQIWVFPLIFVGFAVLAGMWPFHTWAPTGHVAAPTAASMLLAGVVMKLGSYGCFRGAMMLFPQGLEYWKWWIAILAVIGIVYGAGVALVQKDFKFIIGYSSVSHMGFVLLGLATLNVMGMSGAVLQMFSHGIIASLLFAVVGRMVYDRTHTRQLDELGGLAKVIPFACVTFVIGGAASMGMPGFSGFVAEYQILVGAFQMHPLLALAAGLSIPITVAYILNANNKVFMERDEPAGGHGHGHGDEHSSHPPLPPITLPEKVAAIILMALLVIVGLCPSIMLNMIKANIELFLRGGR